MLSPNSFRGEWEREAYMRTHVGLRSYIAYTKNPHFRVWWSDVHDELVKKLFVKHSWRWTEHIISELISTSLPQLRIWKASDPLCRQYSWEGVVECFVAARAIELGLACATQPRKKQCAICGTGFWEDELLPELLDGIGFERIQFCLRCLDRAIYQTHDSASPDDIKSYLLTASDLLGRIPNSRDFTNSRKEILKVQPERASEAVSSLCQNHPSLKSVKRQFGSWLNALIQAGLLADDTRPTSRGTHCIAKDGHVCLSLVEKQIDDWLYDQGISHEREPIYPDGKFRADFKANDILIEYFGLTGETGYDEKTKKKQAICRANGIHLVSIFPKDIVAIDGLDKKLGFLKDG